ncbi:MAG: phosphoenolpyruvate carboxylase [Candidatus Bathyarchaeota archaeon]|jgi:phosphoenolpyruvate carboxylase
MRKIPSTMSTQHPDNVILPLWAGEDIIEGEDEVHEVHFAFNELNCEEQMWDWEGKDVDPNFMRKLFVNYPDFFEEHIIGQDFFITYRVPNPSIEGVEKKGLIEALESIPRCYDLAKSFYKRNVHPPISEVILPLTTNYLELIRVRSYYAKMIVGKEKSQVSDVEDLPVESWVGGFHPKHIEIIPLIEDLDSLCKIDTILTKYIQISKPNYLRVFLARSDPALNYGLIPAVLLAKIALSKMQKISDRFGVKLYPIIGTGSSPFRGHLTPENIGNFLQEYIGVRTVTVQSALKYDYDISSVQQTIAILNKELKKSDPKVMTMNEEDLIKEIITIFKNNYQQKIEKLASIINSIARFVPRRRARKLHIGLFGYSRQIGKTQLPRAISFTAAMYSLGMPPELVSAGVLAELSEPQWKLLDEYYVNWRRDLSSASDFVNWQNLNYLLGEKEIVQKITDRFKLGEVIPKIMEDLEILEETVDFRLGPKTLNNRKHANITNNILLSMAENDKDEINNHIIEAARIRHSLG